jgi:hypothetical protein
LKNNKIGDKGAEELAKVLKNNCYLKKMNLAENNITEVGLVKLLEVL